MNTVEFERIVDPTEQVNERLGRHHRELEIVGRGVAASWVVVALVVEAHEASHPVAIWTRGVGYEALREPCTWLTLAGNLGGPIEILVRGDAASIREKLGWTMTTEAP